MGADRTCIVALLELSTRQRKKSAAKMEPDLPKERCAEHIDQDMPPSIDLLRLCTRAAVDHIAPIEVGM